MALIHWIERDGPGRLGVMARPGRGDLLQRDLQKVKDEGVEVLVSLLTPDEVKRHKLDREREIVEELGMKYKEFPIRDHDIPPANSGTHDFLEARLHELKQGHRVVLHCSSSRGRTSLMAASLMVMEGMDPEKAMQRVRGYRLTIIPDESLQMHWVRALSGRLGRPVLPKKKIRASVIKVGAAVGAAALVALGGWYWKKRRA